MKDRLTKIFPPVIGGAFFSGFLGVSLSSQEIATWYTNAITGAIIGALWAILYLVSSSSTSRVKVTPIIIVFLSTFVGAVLGSLVGISIGAVLVKSINNIVPLISETTTSILLGLIVWFLISAITEMENPKTIPIARLVFSLGIILGWLGGWIGTVLFNMMGKAGNEMALIPAGIGAIIGMCGLTAIVSQIKTKKSSFKITAG